MVLVTSFVENAAKIFQAAESASQTGHSLSDMTILISAAGGIRLVADSDWPLDSLQAHHGAQMAYRVSQQETTVRVQGRAGQKTCFFESEKPEHIARRLLRGNSAMAASYQIVAAADLLPASV